MYLQRPHSFSEASSSSQRKTINQNPLRPYDILRLNPAIYSLKQPPKFAWAKLLLRNQTPLAGNSQNNASSGQVINWWGYSCGKGADWEACATLYGLRGSVSRHKRLLFVLACCTHVVVQFNYLVKGRPLISHPEAVAPCCHARPAWSFCACRWKPTRQQPLIPQAHTPQTHPKAKSAPMAALLVSSTCGRHTNSKEQLKTNKKTNPPESHRFWRIPVASSTRVFGQSCLADFWMHSHTLLEDSRIRVASPKPVRWQSLFLIR